MNCTYVGATFCCPWISNRCCAAQETGR